MTTPAWVIGPESALEEAARLMAREQLHHLPVVEADRLVGMLSAADLIGRNDADRVRTRIGDVMRREPLTLGRNGTLHDAVALLATGNQHSLAVTDTAGKVVGMVTSTDLIALLLRQLAAAGEAGHDNSAAPETVLADLENVRLAADLYLRSGHGEHEHAVLVRALENTREHRGPALPTGRL